MEAVLTSGTLVKLYQFTRRYNPEVGHLRNFFVFSFIPKVVSSREKKRGL
jgi:hypothetical protein